MHNGAIDGFIDHIDGNKTNNKIENLRLANNSQNLLNGKKPKNNKSGVKGVCFDKANNKWLAYGRLDGKTKFLGRFIDKSEAEKIVRQFRIDNHGQFMNHGD
jgi:23S rRNA G2069 N7-methylase RlmK/C1962 C5-methylase RlmI